MENLNRAWFLLINSSDPPGAAMRIGMTFCAEGLIWLVPATLVLGWLRSPAGRRSPQHSDHLATALAPRRALYVEAALAAAIALTLAQLIGAAWPHPRPFMIGLGHLWLPHVADASLPSDHTTLAFSVACSLAWHRPTRAAGISLLLLGLPIGWARVYAGMHFPFDVAAGAALGLVCAALAAVLAPTIVPGALRIAEPIYRRAFAPLIRRGWVAD
jgi:undecaprenyl-diphosphatase